MVADVSAAIGTSSAAEMITATVNKQQDNELRFFPGRCRLGVVFRVSHPCNARFAVRPLPGVEVGRGGVAFLRSYSAARYRHCLIERRYTVDELGSGQARQACPHYRQLPLLSN